MLNDYVAWIYIICFVNKAVEVSIDEKTIVDGG